MSYNLVLAHVTLMSCNVGMHCWPMVENGEKNRPQLHPLVAKRCECIRYSLITAAFCIHSDWHVAFAFTSASCCT